MLRECKRPRLCAALEAQDRRAGSGVGIRCECRYAPRICAVEDVCNEYRVNESHARARRCGRIVSKVWRQQKEEMIEKHNFAVACLGLFENGLLNSVSALAKTHDAMLCQMKSCSERVQRCCAEVTGSKCRAMAETKSRKGEAMWFTEVYQRGRRDPFVRLFPSAGPSFELKRHALFAETAKFIIVLAYSQLCLDTHTIRNTDEDRLFLRRLVGGTTKAMAGPSDR